MQVERIRLFVAIDIPRPHLERIDEAVEPFRSRFENARWTSVDNQHVTLKFLGPSPSDRLEEIERVCEMVTAGRRPAEVRVAALGSFPSRTRVRVLWVGLDDPSGTLGELAHDLEQGFEPLGYRAENRPFTPHLTLARLKVPMRVPEGVPTLDLGELEPFRVDGLVLYRSHLSPKGARYEALRTFPLRGG